MALATIYSDGMMHGPGKTVNQHASCVALGASAVLINGPSGAGKSSLALELMSRGAILVADDSTILYSSGGALWARCPEPIQGRIEARGVGLLAAEFVTKCIVRLAVDLTITEKDRLPPMREITILGHVIPLLHTPAHSHFPAAILQYLKGGRCA